MANADSGRANSRRMADVGADGVSRDGNLRVAHTARAAHTPRAVRNARVEALRLAAIVGISLFHTMMPWTAQALCDPAAGCSRIGDLLGSEPAVLAVLGVIALMGAWGNHVFFMISGFYLIPSLARRSTQAGYWLDALRSTVRRVLVIAQLSYKSTSAASMALAFLLVMVCASGSGGGSVDLARASREAGASGSVAARAVAWLASGILGFYIVQSVFGTVAMDIVIQGLLADVTRWAASGGGAAGLWLLAAGTAVSVGYVAVVAVLDGLIRRPVLRMLRLGR